MKPIIVINYKAYYPQSFGEGAIQIARAAARVQSEVDVQIILAPPHTELFRVIEAVRGTDVKVYAQHADPLEPGAITGFTPLEGIKEIGASGVILNHSEHRLKLSDISYLIRKAHNMGLEVIACADLPETAAALAVLDPEMIAVEPPELIGTGISVSRAKPDVITRSVNMVRRVNPRVKVLTGAGISTGEDVYLAIKLGTSGVLVASAVVKAENKYSTIKEMAVHALRAVRNSSTA